MTETTGLEFLGQAGSSVAPASPVAAQGGGAGALEFQVLLQQCQWAQGQFTGGALTADSAQEPTGQAPDKALEQFDVAGLALDGLICGATVVPQDVEHEAGGQHPEAATDTALHAPSVVQLPWLPTPVPAATPMQSLQPAPESVDGELLAHSDESVPRTRAVTATEPDGADSNALPGEAAQRAIAPSVSREEILRSHQPEDQASLEAGAASRPDPLPNSLRMPAPIADQTPVAGRPAARLDNPVGTHAWRLELAQRINLLIDRGEQVATLRLSPEHLGPLEVRIAVRESEATLWFGASHPETRQALESALPRLREQFAQAGLSLGQSWVSQGSDPGAHRWVGPAATHGLAVADPEDPEPAASLITGAVGLVDTYA